MLTLQLLFSLSAICLTGFVGAEAITNTTDWKDTEGNSIVAHEGDIARFNGLFYWYGSSYANNSKGLFRMKAGGHGAFTCAKQQNT